MLYFGRELRPDSVRHPMPREQIWVLYTTVLIGSLAGLAPISPESTRGPILLTAMMVWTLSISWAVLRFPWRLAAEPGGSYTRWMAILGVAGIAVASLNATHLEIMRLVTGNESLIWNVDWRFALSHAQTVAQTGGVNSALDYAGIPVNYHVGPAWFAGLFQRIFNGGLEDILFGWTPLMSVLSLAFASFLLLKSHNIPLWAAGAATGIAFTAPAIAAYPLELITLPHQLVNADNWLFSVSFMLNSYFALAVSICSLALLLLTGASLWQQVLGVVGLASVITLKPQFFVGIGLLVGITAIARLVSRRQTFAAQPVAHSLVSIYASAGILLLLILSIVLRFAEPSGSVKAQIGLISFLLIVVFGTYSGSVFQEERSTSLLWAAAAAFLLAVATLELIPHFRAPLAIPKFMPGETGWARQEYLTTPILLFLGAMALASKRWQEPRPRAPVTACLGFTWLVVLTFALIALTFGSIQFPVHADILARGLAVGGWNIDVRRQQVELAQALIPLRVLLVAGSVAVIATVMGSSPRWSRRAIVVLTGALVASPFIIILPYSLNPTQGYEAVDDIALLRLLREVPREGSLLISSDIADPAQDYARAGNGVLLSAYAGHAFYLSELRYHRYMQPDAGTRMEDLTTLFGSHWSPWHDKWLEDRGITHILVSDRCFPVWATRTGLPLILEGEYGNWTIYRVERRHHAGKPKRPSEEVAMLPRWGRAECLRLAHVQSHAP